MACNTASGHAICQRQAKHPDKKVLSITVPGVEAIIEKEYKHTLLLATQATLDSGMYPRVHKRLSSWSEHVFIQRAGVGLVDLLENNASEWELLQALSEIIIPTGDIDSLLLWCTHYPELEWLIKKLVWDDIPIINPSLEASKKIKQYLHNHPEISVEELEDKPKLQLYVTSDSQLHPGYGEASCVLI